MFVIDAAKPESCEDCPCFEYHTNQYSMCRAGEPGLNTIYVTWGELDIKPDWCPIVEDAEISIKS